jgi:hypothetical protein
VGESESGGDGGIWGNVIGGRITKIGVESGGFMVGVVVGVYWLCASSPVKL